METKTRGTTSGAPGSAPAVSSPTTTPAKPSPTQSKTAEAGAEAGQAAEEFKQGAESQFRQARGQLRQGLSASEEFVRDYPSQSALIAAGLGVLVAQIPLRYLAAGLVRGAVFLLKPAAVLYAVSKLVEEVRSREEPRQLPEPESP